MDPIADMLTRIRNTAATGKPALVLPSSKLKVAIAELLKRHGYLEDVSTEDVDGKQVLTLTLSYTNGQPAFSRLRRISTPGLRIYRGVQDLRAPRGGFGMTIVSTPKGLMTEREARRAGLGGEVICEVLK